jgi:hypothetical protein
MTETEQTQAARLTAILQKHGVAQCPDCDKPIGLGDVAWNTGGTEEGTEYSVIEIQCVGCDAEILNHHSWYAPIDDIDEILHVLESEWD